MFEAAILDGASHTRAFFQVMLPMARPGLISVGIFNMLGQWNQFILPTVLMQPQSGDDPERYVLTQSLVQFEQQQGYASDLPVLFAGGDHRDDPDAGRVPVLPAPGPGGADLGNPETTDVTLRHRSHARRSRPRWRCPRCAHGPGNCSTS
ncbi:hypothetical protein GCM10020295_18510 [Streptomyces cinereospinus]